MVRGMSWKLQTNCACGLWGKFHGLMTEFLGDFVCGWWLLCARDVNWRGRWGLYIGSPKVTNPAKSTIVHSVRLYRVQNISMYRCEKKDK